MILILSNVAFDARIRLKNFAPTFQILKQKTFALSHLSNEKQTDFVCRFLCGKNEGNIKPVSKYNCKKVDSLKFIIFTYEAYIMCPSA